MTTRRRAAWRWWRLLRSLRWRRRDNRRPRSPCQPAGGSRRPRCCGPGWPAPHRICAWRPGAGLAGLRGQRLQVGQPPAAPGSLVQQAAQLHQVLLALSRIRQRGPGALLCDLDARAQDLARQVGALHGLHARQHGLRLFQPAGARVLFGQHAHETGIVGRNLPPGFQVGHGQPVDGAALAQQAFAQGLAREHQRQADPHHRGESQHQRRRQQPLALNRRSGLRLVAWHGSDR